MLLLKSLFEPNALVDFFFMGGMEPAIPLLLAFSILRILRVSLPVTLLPRQHLIFRAPDSATRPLLFLIARGLAPGALLRESVERSKGRRAACVPNAVLARARAAISAFTRVFDALWRARVLHR